MSESDPIDWGSLGSYEKVLCEFRPRPEYRGKVLKPELADKAGQLILLSKLWLMDEDDPYPGEYALGSAFGSLGLMREMFGVAWLASGDFVRAKLPSKSLCHKLTTPHYLNNATSSS